MFRLGKIDHERICRPFRRRPAPAGSWTSTPDSSTLTCVRSPSPHPSRQPWPANSCRPRKQPGSSASPSTKSTDSSTVRSCFRCATAPQSSTRRTMSSGCCGPSVRSPAQGAGNSISIFRTSSSTTRLPRVRARRPMTTNSSSTTAPNRFSLPPLPRGHPHPTPALGLGAGPRRATPASRSPPPASRSPPPASPAPTSSSLTAFSATISRATISPSNRSSARRLPPSAGAGSPRPAAPAT